MTLLSIIGITHTIFILLGLVLIPTYLLKVSNLTLSNLPRTEAMIILPQPMATIATAAVGVATIILSSASVSNMYETYAIVKQHKRQLHISSPSSPQLKSQVVSKSRCWETIDEAVNGLSNMKKKELIELFIHCNPPDLDTDLVCYHQGGGWVYEGYLLDNGPILVSEPKTNRPPSWQTTDNILLHCY